MTLTWFRVHTILLNDPRRLLATHLIHTSLIARWARSITFYELSVYDPSDPIFNPIWRQRIFVLPFIARLRVVSSWRNWNVFGLKTFKTFWSFERVGIIHIGLSGLLFLAAIWHWVYWDLNCFHDQRTNQTILDLPKIFGIHLFLARFLCFRFRLIHCQNVRFWVSDPYRLTRRIQKVIPVWTVARFDPYNSSRIVSHHLAAGLLRIIAGLFHLCVRPSLRLYNTLRIRSIETVLASSTAAVRWAAFIVAGTIWYRAATTPIELFGTTRYQWDLRFFQEAIEFNVQQQRQTKNTPALDAWKNIPEKLAFYDYIRHNPRKRRLFRIRPIINRDRISLRWLRHPLFLDKNNKLLYVRRIPTFFETFPIILFNSQGLVQADIPFRRSESKYAITKISQIRVLFVGRELRRTVFKNSKVISQYARRAQLRELLEFDRVTRNADGVFRSNPRGWFTFRHLCFSLLFFFRHWWHRARTLFRDIFSRIDENLSEQVEFRSFVKVRGSNT